MCAPCAALASTDGGAGQAAADGRCLRCGGQARVRWAAVRAEGMPAIETPAREPGPQRPGAESQLSLF
jgi:hypothetical protein